MVEQSFVRKWKEGLEGNLRKEGLPPCIQVRLKYFYRQSVHNLLWQFFSVWGFRNADLVLATASFAPLLVNIESLTVKPRAGGGSKYCVMWKVGMPVCYFVHKAKVILNSMN